MPPKLLTTPSRIGDTWSTSFSSCGSRSVPGIPPEVHRRRPKSPQMDEIIVPSVQGHDGQVVSDSCFQVPLLPLRGEAAGGPRWLHKALRHLAGQGVRAEKSKWVLSRENLQLLHGKLSDAIPASLAHLKARPTDLDMVNRCIGLLCAHFFFGQRTQDRCPAEPHGQGVRKPLGG